MTLGNADNARLDLHIDDALFEGVCFRLLPVPLQGAPITENSALPIRWVCPTGAWVRALKVSRL